MHQFQIYFIIMLTALKQCEITWHFVLNFNLINKLKFKLFRLLGLALLSCSVNHVMF